MGLDTIIDRIVYPKVFFGLILDSKNLERGRQTAQMTYAQMMMKLE
jgi:hypothetical protein